MTRVLSDEQLAAYQPVIDNSRRPRELVAGLHDLTLEIVQTDAEQRGRPRTAFQRRSPERA